MLNIKELKLIVNALLYYKQHYEHKNKIDLLINKIRGD
jgi:hypothetical protein